MKKLLLASALLIGCGTEQTSDLNIVGGQRAPYKQYYARSESIIIIITVAIAKGL